MNNKFKKILNAGGVLAVGTIGVGFVALPYAFHKFGTFPSILVLMVVAIITTMTNLAYSDIITKDKKNMQLPGYVNLSFGLHFKHIVTIVTSIGLYGVVFAYAKLAGEILSSVIDIPSIQNDSFIFSMVATLFSIFILKYGMSMISKFSTLSIIIMLLLFVFLFANELKFIDVQNITSFSPSNFSMLFGISLFSFFGLSSVPMLDEIVGYNEADYKKSIILSSVIVFSTYLLFSLIFSLVFGNAISSTLVELFISKGVVLFIVVSSALLLAIMTSYVQTFNTIKEMFVLDYKVKDSYVFLFTLIIVGLFIYKNISSFESLLSFVGNFSLALQSLMVMLIWLKTQTERKLIYKISVAISAGILLIGIISQI